MLHKSAHFPNLDTGDEIKGGIINSLINSLPLSTSEVFIIIAHDPNTLDVAYYD